jgi:hypothetical protein
MNGCRDFLPVQIFAVRQYNRHTGAGRPFPGDQRPITEIYGCMPNLDPSYLCICIDLARWLFPDTQSKIAQT